MKLTSALLKTAMGPAGFKREGNINYPIAQPCAPAHGSADIAIGMLFGLNPEAMSRGTYLRPSG